MAEGCGMLRAALCLTSLVLLAAAGTHVCVIRTQGGGLWSHSSVAQAAHSGWRLPLWQPAGGGGAPAALAEQEQVLHATLELPDHTLLEVGEDTTLEELVQKLLFAQTKGVPLPSGIEIVSVERVTIRQPSLLSSALHAVARVLPATWLLPATWQRDLASPGVEGVSAAADESIAAAAELLADAGSSLLADGEQMSGMWDASAAEEAAAAAIKAAAAVATASGSAGGGFGGAAAAEEEEEEEQRLPMTAFDYAYVDDAYVEEEEVEEKGAELPGRKLSQHHQMHKVALAEEQHHPGKQGWHAIKLFGPRRPALLQLRTAAAGAGAADDEPVVRVWVTVTLGKQQPQQQQRAQQAQQSGSGSSSGSSQVLHVEQLVVVPGELQGPDASTAGAAGEAEGDGGAATFHAAAAADGGATTGIRVHMTLSEAALPQQRQAEHQRQGEPEQQQQAQRQQQQDAVRAVVLAAVDGVFVVALAVALVCAALLAADVVRHGWRQAPAAANAAGKQQVEDREQLLRVPLLVVAADEVAAMEAGCSCCCK